MTDIQIGLLSIVGILFLIYAGMHVSIALMLLSLLGVWLIKGNWTIASKLLALAQGRAPSEVGLDRHKIKLTKLLKQVMEA